MGAIRKLGRRIDDQVFQPLKDGAVDAWHETLDFVEDLPIIGRPIESIGEEVERFGETVHAEWHRWGEDLEEAGKIIEDNWEVIVAAVVIAVATAGTGSAVSAGMIAGITTTASLTLDGKWADVARIAGIFYGNLSSIGSNGVQAVGNQYVQATIMTVSDVAGRELAEEFVEQTGLDPSLVPIVASSFSAGLTSGYYGYVDGATLQEAIIQGGGTIGEHLIRNGFREQVATQVADRVFEELDLSSDLEGVLRTVVSSAVSIIGDSERFIDPTTPVQSIMEMIADNLDIIKDDLIDYTVEEHIVSELLDKVDLDIPESLRGLMVTSLGGSVVGMIDDYYNGIVTEDQFAQLFEVAVREAKLAAIESLNESPELGVRIVKDVVAEIGLPSDLEDIIAIGLSAAAISATDYDMMRGSVFESIMANGSFIVNAMVTHGLEEHIAGPLLGNIDNLPPDLEAALKTGIGSSITTALANVEYGFTVQDSIVMGISGGLATANQEMSRLVSENIVGYIDELLGQIDAAETPELYDQILQLRENYEQLSEADIERVILESVNRYDEQVVQQLPEEAQQRAHQDMLQNKEITDEARFNSHMNSDGQTNEIREEEQRAIQAERNEVGMGLLRGRMNVSDEVNFQEDSVQSDGLRTSSNSAISPNWNDVAGVDDGITEENMVLFEREVAADLTPRGLDSWNSFGGMMNALTGKPYEEGQTPSVRLSQNTSDMTSRIEGRDISTDNIFT